MVATSLKPAEGPSSYQSKKIQKGFQEEVAWSFDFQNTGMEFLRLPGFLPGSPSVWRKEGERRGGRTCRWSGEAGPTLPC